MLSNIINKISNWWRGEWQEPTMEEIFEHDEIPDKYKHHWSASLARLIRSFWLKHWKALLPIIVGTSVALFIHFDSKSTSETKQKENHQITSAYHVKNLP